jgi:hypothetical protein
MTTTASLCWSHTIQRIFCEIPTRKRPPGRTCRQDLQLLQRDYTRLTGRPLR